MSASVDVRTSGPFFDSRRKQAVEGYLTDAKTEVAQQGVNDVQARLGLVLKHPTGRYEAHIVTDRQINDMAVTDSGIVYGPWLEGTSSRNQTTRFKGYATFRRTRDELQRKAHGIAEAVLRHWLGRLQ